jgi:iron complex outermembrane receptor protein
VRGTFKINDDMQAFADFWASRNETVQLMGPASISSTTNVFNPATGSVAPLPRTVAGTNPFNPFGVDTPINLTFPNNVASADTVSTFWKASAGVKGSFTTQKLGDWDWSADMAIRRVPSIRTTRTRSTWRVSRTFSATASITSRIPLLRRMA